MMAYQYSVLRFVPDPARGEAINLGVIAGDDDAREWDIRLISNYRRARAIDDRDLLPGALAFATRLEDHIQALDLPDETEVEPMSTEFLERLSVEMRNVVQISSPVPVLAESAAAALDLAFGEVTLDPASRSHPFEKKHRAVASTNRAYAEHRVPSEFIARRARIHSGAYDGTFDFVVFNGTVVQLVQCWSFQLPGQEELAEQVKAWAWVARSVLAQGGSLSADAKDVEIPSADPETLGVVYVPPREGQSAHAFDEAQAAFEEFGVRAVTPEHATDLGEIAAARLGITSSPLRA